MNDNLSTTRINQNTDEKEMVNLLTIYKIEVFLVMGRSYSNTIKNVPMYDRKRLVLELDAYKNSKRHYMCSKKNAWNYFYKLVKNKLDELKISSYDELYYTYMKNNC